jgi:hypothetical protein
MNLLLPVAPKCIDRQEKTKNKYCVIVRYLYCETIHSVCVEADPEVDRVALEEELRIWLRVGSLDVTVILRGILIDRT